MVFSGCDRIEMIHVTKSATYMKWGLLQLIAMDGVEPLHNDIAPQIKYL